MGRQKDPTPPECLLPFGKNLKTFRPQCADRVYFLCEGDEVVYVGRTTNLARRVLSHQLDKTFSRVFFIEVCSADAAEVEQELITNWRPRYNKLQGDPRWQWIYTRELTKTPGYYARPRRPPTKRGPEPTWEQVAEAAELLCRKQPLSETTT